MGKGRAGRSFNFLCHYSISETVHGFEWVPAVRLLERVCGWGVGGAGGRGGGVERQSAARGCLTWPQFPPTSQEGRIGRSVDGRRLTSHGNLLPSDPRHQDLTM